MKTYFTSRNLLFLAIFVVLGLIALQIPTTGLAGSKASFTLFDFFSPIAGGFLGGALGVIAVALMELINFVMHGTKILDSGTLIAFFPPLFAALYFAKKQSWMLIVPVIAIISFVSDPIGRSVWYYSLYWLIPIVCYFVYDRSLIARALGSTFMAHAVGGALWIHVFHLPKSVWVGLIPVVAEERLLMTAGIVVTYLLVNNALNFLATERFKSLMPLVNKHYVLGTR